MTNSQKNQESKKEGAVKPASENKKEIHTEGPLSEKDEVKQAENKTNKAVKGR